MRNFFSRTADFGSRLFPYLYLVAAGSFVVGLCFVQPPFEIPDEPAHFFRAAQISHLDFAPHFAEGNPLSGAVLPAALSQFAGRQLSPEIRYGIFATPAARLRSIRSESEHQQSVEVTAFLSFPNTVVYHPLYYLPQAVAIAATRLFSSKVYLWFFSARIANAITAVILVFLALRVSRPQQFVLASVAILPMSLSQMASLSPDACQIGGAVLFTSICLRLREQGTRFFESLCFLLGAWLIVVRPVLFPGVLALILTTHAKTGWRRAAVLCAAVGVVALVLWAQWAPIAAPSYTGIESLWHSDPHLQINCFLQHPSGIFPLLASTWKVSAYALFHSFIGDLSWGGVSMRSWYYPVSAVVLFVLVSLFLDFRQVWSTSGLLLLGGEAGILAATFASMYLLFTPPCANVIMGAQGRYFLAPFAFLAIVCGSKLNQWNERFLSGCILCTLFMTITFVATAGTLRKSYYGRQAVVSTAVPMGHVEFPVPHSHIGERVTLSGWAVSTDPIDHISIFVDGVFKQSVRPNLLRPDVDQIALHAANGHKGWSAVLGAAGLALGKHDIVVRATTVKGVDGIIGQVQVERF